MIENKLFQGRPEITKTIGHEKGELTGRTISLDSLILSIPLLIIC